MKTKETAKCFYFGVGATYWLDFKAFKGLAFFGQEVKWKERLMGKPP